MILMMMTKMMHSIDMKANVNESHSVKTRVITQYDSSAATSTPHSYTTSVIQLTSVCNNDDDKERKNEEILIDNFDQ